MAKVYLPSSLSAVFRIMSDEPSARLFAGGTDLMVRSSPQGTESPLVCLEGVGELRGIDESSGEVRIGAATTHGELISSSLIGDVFPVLGKAARHIGAPAVRNMGTIGGNICTASPAGDTLPALYILGAEVELRSPRGERRMPIDCFISGPGRTELRSGEVLCAVVIGKDHGFNFHHFEKVGQRKAMAISVASLAFAASIGADGTAAKARCAFGSVAPTVFTSRALDDCLAGNPMTKDVLARAAAIAREEVCPISDVRASEEYRRRVTGNLLMRLEGARKD
ncbi:MAG: xanthine dehydrogenase family protein subunit M [Syntrophorhabdaceae bacterium]|nr:xanthine dehydrogenase family protein subunit M [Syntrophorhabdaceae bacterium]